MGSAGESCADADSFLQKICMRMKEEKMRREHRTQTNIELTRQEKHQNAGTLNAGTLEAS